MGSRAVTVSGLVVLLSGALPWWVVRLTVAGAAGLHPQSYAGTAWSMSSRWTGALLLTVLAVGFWLVSRLTRRWVSRALWLTSLAAVVLSVFLTLDQRDAARSPTAAERSAEVVGVPADAAGPLAASLMRRDHPVAMAGVSAAGLGFWIGLTGMILTGMSLAAAGPARPARRPPRPV